MRLIFSFAITWFVLFAANALCAAQTPSAGDVGENARHQAADNAFAEAEQRLTIRLLDKTIAQADANAALLAEVSTAASKLSERVTLLKTNDEGKRLAAALDEISAGQVQQLINEPPVQPEALEAKKKEIESVSDDLKKLRKDPPPGFVLPDQQQDELSKTSVSLRNMLARTRERDGWLTSLLSAAPKNIDLAKSPTLEAALSDFRSRQQQAWNAAQRKGIDEAKPEGLKQITESARIAELERSLEQSRAMLAESRQATEASRLDSEMQVRLLKEQKDREVALLNKKLAESEAQRAVVNAQTDATVQKGKVDADKIRLRQKCDDPEVKKLLTPFTSTGLWQPGDKVGQPWIRERGPISFSALKRYGALDATQTGLRQLYIAGNGSYEHWPNGQHPDTDRAKWGYSRFISQLTQDDWQQLRHAQDLLNELGPTMVELGMLSK